jgi:hypothetical protein
MAQFPATSIYNCCSVHRMAPDPSCPLCVSLNTPLSSQFPVQRIANHDFRQQKSTGDCRCICCRELIPSGTLYLHTPVEVVVCSIACATRVFTVLPGPDAQCGKANLDIPRGWTSELCKLPKGHKIACVFMTHRLK